jgi:amidohydrolase family protein
MGRTELRTLIPVLALALAAPVLAQKAQPVTAWENGRWFDGTAFKKADVYSIGARLTLKPPTRVDRHVDLADGYVTGAFGEAHNHNIPSGDTDATIRTYLQQGIFYVMIQGNQPDVPPTLAGTINTPTSVDVAFANGLFTAPGGHPTALVRRNIANGGMRDVDLRDGFILAAPSTDDVDRLWWRVVRPHRPDFIKIVLVYSEDREAGIATPASSDRYGLDPALVSYIVRKAHRDGWRVSAHVESARDFEIAVAAGVDVIAHFPGFWPDPARVAAKGAGIYAISDVAAAQAAKNRASVVTTLGEALRTFESDKQYAALREPMLRVYRDNLAKLAVRGVRLAVGSDQFRSTSVPEALELQKAGLLSPAALLRALTVDTPATIFPRRAPFGLAEGAPADFLVFETDPLADFTAIERISRRVKAGNELR